MLNRSKLRVYLDIFLSKLTLKRLNDLIFYTKGIIKSAFYVRKQN